jgi:hypothetical protein
MATHDYIINNSGGRAVRLDFNDALMALVTCNSGPTEPPVPYAGMLWLDTSVLPDGIVRQRNQSNTGWVTMSGMPPEATDLEAIAGVSDVDFVTPAGYQARLNSVPAWQSYNCLVNPAMRISQENGDTAFALTSGTYYMADQWMAAFGTNTGLVVSCGRVASTTPRKSTYRLRLVVTTPKVTLAAGDYASVLHRIEGVRVPRLGWGGFPAYPVTVRFGFRGPSGTYNMTIRNTAPPYYSFVAPFTITGAQHNLDTEQVFVVPATAAGAWPSLGLAADAVNLWITLAAGTTYQGPDGWSLGNFVGSTSTSNNVDTVSQIFEIFDAGLYIDYRNTGVVPRWSVPTYEEDQLACQRYYVTDVRTMFSGAVTTGSVYYSPSAAMPVDMRISPAAVLNATHLGAVGFAATVGTISIIAIAAGRFKLREARTSNVTTGGYYWSKCDVSARM